MLIPSLFVYVYSDDEFTNISFSTLSNGLRTHDAVMTAREDVQRSLCHTVTLPLCFGSTPGFGTCFEISPGICRVDSVLKNVLQQTGAAVVSPGLKRLAEYKDVCHPGGWKFFFLAWLGSGSRFAKVHDCSR